MLSRLKTALRTIVGVVGDTLRYRLDVRRTPPHGFRFPNRTAMMSSGATFIWSLISPVNHRPPWPRSANRSKALTPN